MKKSKLIELLNNLEGDPNILLWNGGVGDWMDIDKNFIESNLVKMTFAGYIRAIENERIRHAHKDLGYIIPKEEYPELKKNYNKNIEWEDNEFINDCDILNKRYTKKSVIMINSKSRGVRTWDRLGTINY